MIIITRIIRIFDNNKNDDNNRSEDNVFDIISISIIITRIIMLMADNKYCHYYN